MCSPVDFAQHLIVAAFLTYSIEAKTSKKFLKRNIDLKIRELFGAFQALRVEKMKIEFSKYVKNKM
jgi:hypothetical protein